jgi:hypothetical protein
VNYLRRIKRHAIEAMRGKTFPRAVTAPDGSGRWQNRTGRSFKTFEEALEV